MKPASFEGSSLDDLKAFPPDAMQQAGYQLDRVQRGLKPSDWKPMPSIGAGVEEIRIHVQPGEFRVIYVANRGDAIYVLHCFGKKTRATPKRELDIARRRLSLI